MRSGAQNQHLGHLDGEGVKFLGVCRCLGQPDIFVGARGSGVDRHAHLVIADVDARRTKPRSPTCRALDFVPEVEGRLRGVEHTAVSIRASRYPGIFAASGPQTCLKAVGGLADRRRRSAGDRPEQFGEVDFDQNLSGRR